MVNKYRSLLFVPATEKMLPKIENCKADAVIVDLEDAILEEDKDNALYRLEGFLKVYSYKKDLFARINPMRMEKETAILNQYDIKGYMLPKTEKAADVDLFAEAAGDKQIIALIESAMGIVNSEEIIINNNVSMAAFGAEDYTTQCGIENKPEFLVYPKSKLVAVAKAYKKPVIDTISLEIHNIDSYTKEAESSKKFGFDGKLAIHPMQVDTINRIFCDDLEYYKYIVAEYEKKNEAVLNINGKIFEKPHIDAMRRRIEGTKQCKKSM